MTDPMTSDASAFVQGKVVPVTYCVGPKDGSMITATQHLEASPKPSYGPHKASERYLDDEDLEQVNDLVTLGLAATLTGVKWYSDGTATPIEKPTVEATLQALETLRTHLRKKYYAG